MTFRSTDREILALETSISGVIDGIAGVDLIRSADGGDSWEDVEAPQTAAVCTGPAGCIYLGTYYTSLRFGPDGHLFVAAYDPPGLYRSGRPLY